MVAYEEGEMELVALLDAAEATHAARTDRARLQADLWIAYFDLERALGGFPAPGQEDQP
jgi:outer membrane protein TolC